VPEARVPPFWLAIRWKIRSWARMPLTVTASRSRLVLMSSMANAGAGASSAVIGTTATIEILGTVPLLTCGCVRGPDIRARARR
jgi:hypothetical protein